MANHCPRNSSEDPILPETPAARRLPATPIILLTGSFFLLGALYLVGMRLSLADTTPLWLDETWSGMIATRPDWSSFWREAWLDCNPPLYYLLLTGWVTLFGDSNLMLRLPSILFVLAAALLPLLWRPRTLGRTGAWTWAALLFLWPPNLGIMVDARGYGLMMMLSTASCLTVAHLLERLTLRWAMLWVGLGTLMFLTHYYAAVLILGQILVLLYRHRLNLAQLWPAMIVATPGLGWFAYHLPRLADYARDDVAWYDPTSLSRAMLNLAFVLGAQNIVALFAVIALVIVATIHMRRQQSDILSSGSDPLPLTALTAVIGFAIAILVSLFQPSLTDRYLVPLVPSAMLGLTLLIQRTPRPDHAALGMAFAFMAPVLNPALMRTELGDRTIYGYEQGSDFIRAERPDRVLFLWDSPSAKIMDRASLAAIGGYFLARPGMDVPVEPLVVDRKADPNAILRAHSISGRPALIWLYNAHYRSAAKDHPPTLQDDPSWHCNRGTRTDIVGSIACIKRVQ